MYWYIKVLKQYADFSGRARRKEYWMFILFSTIFTVSAILFDHLLQINFKRSLYGPFYVLYGLIIFIPNLAVIVRRLHDTGKSGWMVLVSFIPILGAIWLLILMIADSEPGENAYGPNPKNEQNLIKQEEITNLLHRNDLNKDNLVIIFVSWILFSQLFWSILPLLTRDYYNNSWFMPLSSIFRLIWVLIPFLLVFLVKEKNKRIIVLILVIAQFFTEFIKMIGRF